MPTCVCGKYYGKDQYLTRHERRCEVVHKRAREAFEAGQEYERQSKLPRMDTEEGGSTPQPDDGATVTMDIEMSGHLPMIEIAGTATAMTAPELAESSTRRSHRVRRPTWKVVDMLPEEPEPPPAPPSPAPAPPDSTSPDADTEPHNSAETQLPITTEKLKVPADSFGITRIYPAVPTPVSPISGPNPFFRLPHTSLGTPVFSPRPVSEIIHPYPNLSSWRFAYHHWMGSRSKSLEDREALQALITRPDFSTTDLVGVDFRQLDKQLEDTPLPWQDRRNGWRESTLTIGIPSGVKQTLAAKKAAAAEARVSARTETLPDQPAEIDVAGHHFEIPGFWHRSITQVITSVFGHNTDSKDFHFHPYEKWYQRPGVDGPPERVYDELFTTQAFLDADAKLQSSPHEPGCALPRAVAALMFASDSTHVAQFGQAKLWPGYLYVGNQSKYTRAKPRSRAAHHIAYIPSLPGNIQDFVRQVKDDKGASAPLLAHCRRELFHAAWEKLLDEEFLEAYQHGLVIKCTDGIVRRIYPRMFVYSADYPEKVLIATIRDMGGCPCPRCLVTIENLGLLGHKEDRDCRVDKARIDNDDRRNKIIAARKIIYQDGYVVNSEKVEDLLKSESLVPTKNAFSPLAQFGFNLFVMLVVDLMHEFELGVWKVVFAHLIRILEAADATLVLELNRRFRLVPIFGKSTIRRFCENVSEMKKLAARDFEDILQCAIPCFEGLLPSPHNEQLLDLLYTLAAWHSVAKFRLQTESSLKVLDRLTTWLGKELRLFQRVTCAAFETRETEQEYAARGRAEARRQPRKDPPATRPAIGTSNTGRRRRTFNLKQYKVHALGDYVSTIRMMGTTDSYSTQISELEHRRLKVRYQHTNKNQATGQIVSMDVREAEMRRMAQELVESGVEVPGFKPKGSEEVNEILIATHVSASKEQRHRNARYLGPWLARNATDPAFTDFLPRLRAHLQGRLKEHILTTIPAAAITAGELEFYFRDERIYQHSTIRFHFTTYDLQRDQDLINPTTDKCNILVSLGRCDEAATKLHPFGYARVIGVFHAQLEHRFSHDPVRLDFLWVRWYSHHDAWGGGDELRRLDPLQFVPGYSSDAFGFLDPSHVIRGCHIIPAYSDGTTTELLGPSLARHPDGDYVYYYANRFVDRDMASRYLGHGVGHPPGSRADPEPAIYQLSDEDEEENFGEVEPLDNEIEMMDEESDMEELAGLDDEERVEGETIEDVEDQYEEY
ncbi:hypothetical protein JAAARDRAFT_199318 [Jaapia argillacea MUCL 33604]|uniref:Uncharacterized protein n=1 Tax=Jaapia argillacea MUCL 33604 TaxID=933084 RepID=A0A067P8Q5_9AGAM|nr:hypothetical protein JAAARDRAFT_199318 [Jaapia argillacea MUCL 33604]